MTASTRFEDRLLAELRQIVAENPAPAARVVTHRPPRRTRLALAGAGVAAATAAVAIVATSSDVTSSAYAVEPRSDGSVSVEIHSLRDADGLERALRAEGIPANVEYAPAGQGCVTQAPTPSGSGSGTAAAPSLHRESGGTDSGPSLSGPGPKPGDGATTNSVTLNEDGVTFTIEPGSIKPGQEVFITTSDGEMSSIAMAVAKDRPAVPCAP